MSSAFHSPQPVAPVFRLFQQMRCMFWVFVLDPKIVAVPLLFEVTANQANRVQFALLLGL
jgi:hypothetical protein